VTVTIRTLDEIGYVIWSPKGVAGPLVDDAIADAKARGYTDMDVSEWLRVELRRPAPQPPAEPWWYALLPGEQIRAKEQQGCPVYHADNSLWLDKTGAPRLATWAMGVIAIDKTGERIQVALPAQGWPGGLWVRPGDVVRAI